MAYKRVLTVQDISCVGQCSMTVALPILSACGVETCILPTAVLSSHTGGFQGVRMRDLSQDIPGILDHWRREGITFDWIYTGYLGSTAGIRAVLEGLDGLLSPGGKLIVDPAMADHGKLYKGLDESYAAAMETLCRRGDIVIPNITEACMLTGREYRTDHDNAWVDALLASLRQKGMRNIVLTGITGGAEETGVAVFSAGERWDYLHKKTPKSFHGTGDIFAAAFSGACAQEKDIREAARIAADFTALAITNTYAQPAHWYGVKFETALPQLMRMLGSI